MHVILHLSLSLPFRGQWSFFSDTGALKRTRVIAFHVFWNLLPTTVSHQSIARVSATSVTTTWAQYPQWSLLHPGTIVETCQRRISGCCKSWPAGYTSNPKLADPLLYRQVRKSTCCGRKKRFYLKDPKKNSSCRRSLHGECLETRTCMPKKSTGICRGIPTFMQSQMQR